MPDVPTDVANTVYGSLPKVYPAIERVLGHMRLRLCIPLHECSRTLSLETLPKGLGENLDFGKAIAKVVERESTAANSLECCDEDVSEAQIEYADVANIVDVRGTDEILKNDSYPLNVDANAQKQKYFKAKLLALKKSAEFGQYSSKGYQEYNCPADLNELVAN